MSQAKTFLNLIETVTTAQSTAEGIANIEDPQDALIIGALTKLRVISSMTHMPLLTFGSDLGLEFFNLVKEGHWDKMSTMERIGWVTGHVATDALGAIIPGADDILEMGADWVKENLGFDLQEAFEGMGDWFKDVFTGDDAGSKFKPKITNPAFFMDKEQRQAAAQAFTRAHSSLKFLREGVMDGNKTLAEKVNWLLNEASLKGVDAQELLTGRDNPLQSDWLAPKLLTNEDYSLNGFTEQSYNTYLKQHNVGEKLRQWLTPDHSQPVLQNRDQLDWFKKNYVDPGKTLASTLAGMGLNHTHFISKDLAQQIGVDLHESPQAVTPPTKRPRPEPEPPVTTATPSPPPQPQQPQEAPITEYPRPKAMRIRDFA